MTIHVLHAGDGYLYLIRSVAAHDGRLGAGEALAGYYAASGNPPGRWAGNGAKRLGVAGIVTEDQMKALFGEGMHPDALMMEARLVQEGLLREQARRALRLGRRFPRYGAAADLRTLAADAYKAAEARLGRPLEHEEKLGVRQQAARAEFQQNVGRAALDPHELTTLGKIRASREAVAGYDFVFTPVKSVSLLWALGSERTREEVFAAHKAAVSDALQWLESNVALTRTGDFGQAQINTLGITAAFFHHWDSRAGDPDLHTHVAVSNKVQGPDEKWRSLDGRPLFEAAVSLSERYNTRIEDELRARLGVEFVERAKQEDGRRPVREIAGVPDVLIEGFSKRRHGIEQHYQEFLADYRAKHGREPAADVRSQLYQQATLSTRPEKQHGRSLHQMVVGWRNEANRIVGSPASEFDIERLTLAKGAAMGPIEIGEMADLTLQALMAGRTTWNIHHIRAEAHRQSRSVQVDNRDELIEAVLAVVTSATRSIRIETPRTLSEPFELRRADGESVFVEHGSTRFTSTQILAAERAIVEAAKCRSVHRLSGNAVDDAIVQAEVAERSLNAQQVQMVRDFCTSGRAVQLGLAPAGSGKTTAMRAVAEAWTASGRPMVALAPSAVAADVLGAELGIRAETLAKFDCDDAPIAPGTMILVDEAGMAGTLVLARLVERAGRAGAVVRLLGDDQQLGAVEAGGVLRHLDHEVGSVRLTEVIRFSDPVEATATLQVRDGHVAAVSFYLDRARIVAGTELTIPDAAYNAWLADIHEGRNSLLLAASAQAVAELNARARADLVVDGRVEVDGVPLRDGNVAAVGEQICTRRNARRLIVGGGQDWVKNGDGWRVIAVHDDSSLTVQHRTHRGRVTLPADYVQTEVELDYARTIRRAQGLTVDHAHLIVDPRLNREDLYVGLSRARHGTRLYVVTMTDPRPDHLPDAAGAARDILASIIERPGNEPSASEAIRDAIAALGDLRRMAVEYEHALGVHVADRYKTAAEALHPGITADTAWPAAAHRLHLAEAAGLAIDDTLRRAEQIGSYADARSATQVLVFRLDRILAAVRRHEEQPPPVPDWLAARPPRTADEPWRTYLAARYDEMANRLTTLAAEATACPAAWLANLGHGSARGEVIRQVAAYRAVYAISDDDPVGPEPPRHTRQHQAWQATLQAVTSSRTSPAQPGAASRLAEALALPTSSSIDDAARTDTRGGPTRTA